MYVEEEELVVLLAAMAYMGLPGMGLLTLVLQDRMLGVVYGRVDGWSLEGLTQTHYIPLVSCIIMGAGLLDLTWRKKHSGAESHSWVLQVTARLQQVEE